MIGHNVHGLDDVWVLESAPHAELGCHLLLVLLLRLALSLRPKLLHGEGGATVLRRRLDQTDRTAST